MIIIGERINSTSKKVFKALEERDSDFIKRIAFRQINAGAKVLDLNTSAMMDREEDAMRWLINILQTEFDITLCLDSPSFEIIKSVYPLCKKSPIINSITNEEPRRSMLAEFMAVNPGFIIALPLGAKGKLPQTKKEKLEEAEILLEFLQAKGIPPQRVLLDPIVTSFATTAGGAMGIIEVLKEFKRLFPDVKTVAGVSNISYGFPGRVLLNGVFLVLLEEAGLDYAIINPARRVTFCIMKAGEALLGNDKYGLEYIKAVKDQQWLS